MGVFQFGRQCLPNYSAMQKNWYSVKSRVRWKDVLFCRSPNSGCFGLQTKRREREANCPSISNFLLLALSVGEKSSKRGGTRSQIPTRPKSFGFQSSDHPTVVGTRSRCFPRRNCQTVSRSGGTKSESIDHQSNQAKNEVESKKKSFFASEQDTERVKQIRARYLEQIKHIPRTDLVFLDESGSKLSMTRSHGYGQKGKRVR